MAKYVASLIVIIVLVVGIVAKDRVDNMTHIVLNPFDIGPKMFIIVFLRLLLRRRNNFVIESREDVDRQPIQIGGIVDQVVSEVLGCISDCFGGDVVADSSY